ncbi:hypothetical protein [Klebsiella grimontii]|uniref:hypothetical protein n=1 Tax=Klebsiella grimontii TaxID=2058152 RepID=UPI0022438FF9|nr:hypothetical protein [Klebsiella grimontii]
MPSEYDEQLDSTDTQLPGEYDLFDLMAQVTEENLHAPVGFLGPPVGRRKRYKLFSLARVRGNTRYYTFYFFIFM